MLEKQQMIIQAVSNGFIVVSPRGQKAIVCTTIDEACDIVKKESAAILADAETKEEAPAQESNPDDSQE